VGDAAKETFVGDLKPKMDLDGFGAGGPLNATLRPSADSWSVLS
jgi:hypothetical protein